DGMTTKRIRPSTNATTSSTGFFFFKQKTAYEILSDPQKKTRYDAILGGTKKPYTTESKTTYTRKTKSSYDQWMAYQAQKARQKATQKAHMKYNKYKKQQFGKGAMQTKSSFLSALAVIAILFLITIRLAYDVNKKMPKNDRQDM